MSHLVYIRTKKFDGVKEEPNPYNPITEPDAAYQIRAVARLRKVRLEFLSMLPGVVALPESRSTPGYYRPPFQGFQFAAAPRVQFN